MSPTLTERRKLVGLLAQYVLVDGAPIHRQQGVYDAYMKYFTFLEKKYPQVDFRAESTTQSLTQEAKRLASCKVVRGAGAIW